MVAPCRRGEGEEVRVGPRLRTRLHLLSDQAGERLRFGEPARQRHAGDDAAPVGLGGKVVGDEARRRERVRRGERDGAAAFRPELADGDREAGERMHLSPGHVGRQGRHVELDVRASPIPAARG